MNSMRQHFVWLVEDIKKKKNFAIVKDIETQIGGEVKLIDWIYKHEHVDKEYIRQFLAFMDTEYGKKECIIFVFCDMLIITRKEDNKYCGHIDYMSCIINIINETQYIIKYKQFSFVITDNDLNQNIRDIHHAKLKFNSTNI